jgi:hypothetical protein
MMQAAMTSMNPAHVYEIRPRKDDCGVNLISDVLPLRCAVLAGGPEPINNAIDYAKLYSRSHVSVIRVYDEAGNVMKTHEQRPRRARCSTALPDELTGRAF